VANFTAGTSFTDGVTNDVTAAKLNALVADAVPTSNLALASTTGTISNFTASTANITLGTIPTLTAGTTTGTAGIFTSGTLTTALIPTGTFGTTTSTAATITTGTIPTLTTGTTTSTNAVVTNGTIINLSATTSTFLGTITGSTNVVNIGSGQIYKDSSGNVGIGTTSPTKKLHVVGPAANGVGNEAILIDANSVQLAVRRESSGQGTIELGTPNNHNLGIFTNGTVGAFFASGGKVGIGTMSPAAKLDVYGDGYFTNIELGRGGQTGNRNVLIDFTGDDTYTDYGFRILRENGGPNANTNLANRGTGGLYLTTVEAGFIALQTSNTERMRIDSSGNVTVTNNFQTGDSRTTSAIKLGTFGHAIGRDSAAGALYIGGGQDSIVLQNVITSQPTYDNTAAGSNVVVTSAGLIRRTSSSLKYKKDIENLDSSIVDNAIDRLRPVWYRTKNPEGDDKSTWSHVGLIAEEVDSVEPRLVRYKTVEVSTNENGERIETQLENPVPEDVDYARLSVILLSEVKAQRIKIASLEARLEALEAA
jgi:Chaperone of endosialidase